MLPSCATNQRLQDLTFLADRNGPQPVAFPLPFSAPCAAQQEGWVGYLLSVM